MDYGAGLERLNISKVNRWCIAPREFESHPRRKCGLTLFLKTGIIYCEGIFEQLLK